MKHPATAAATFALGVSLAAAAYAQTGDGRAGTVAPTPPGAVSNGGVAAVPPDVNQSMPAGEASVDVSQREIAEAQQQMRSEGIYRGPIDGIMGPQTREALADFQLRDGIPRTATLDSRTRARLRSRSVTSGAGSSTAPTVVLRGTGVPPANALPNNGAGGNAAAE